MMGSSSRQENLRLVFSFSLMQGCRANGLNNLKTRLRFPHRGLTLSLFIFTPITLIKQKSHLMLKFSLTNLLISAYACVLTRLTVFWESTVTFPEHFIVRMQIYMTGNKWSC